jgi:chaperonin GroES
MSKLKPLRDRIAVKLIESEAVTAFGLIIPDSASEKPTQGEVVEVGSGGFAKDGTVVPLVVKPGDRILFSKHAGQTLKVDGEEYHILREEEIVAIIG